MSNFVNIEISNILRAGMERLLADTLATKRNAEKRQLSLYGRDRRKIRQCMDIYV